MKFITNDNFIPEHIDDHSDLDEIYLEWPHEPRSIGRGVSLFRMGSHGIIMNNAGPGWIIEINYFHDGEPLEACIFMAYDRVGRCMDVISIFKNIDNDYARECISYAKAELNDYNTLIQKGPLPHPN